jgi:hypothetical protein
MHWDMELAVHGEVMCEMLKKVTVLTVYIEDILEVLKKDMVVDVVVHFRLREGCFILREHEWDQ